MRKTTLFVGLAAAFVIVGASASAVARESGESGSGHEDRVDRPGERHGGRDADRVRGDERRGRERVENERHGGRAEGGRRAGEDVGADGIKRRGDGTIDDNSDN